MNILIVDDNETKIGRIKDVLNILPEKLMVHEANTVSSGVSFLQSNKYDMLLLDLNLPIRENELPKKDGGISLLKEMRRNGNLIKPSYVIGITDYEELKIEYQIFFETEGWVLVAKSSNVSWDDTILNTVAHIREQRTQKVARKKILFLSANPLDSSRLRVDEEAKRIEDGLLRSKERDNLHFLTKFAVDFETASQAILDYEPDIIHFSGHSNTNGVAFEDRSGNSTLIATSSLLRLFEVFKGKLSCVVLNSCESTDIAEQISKLDLFVVGADTEISDDTAISFSIGFYQGIGAGKDIGFAFKLGLAHASVINPIEAEIPKLWLGGSII